MKIAKESKPAAPCAGKAVGMEPLGFAGWMRAIPRREWLQLLLMVVALSRELLTGLLYVGLVGVTISDLPVRVRKSRTTGLHETQT